MPTTLLTGSTNARKTNGDLEEGADSAAKKIEAEKTETEKTVSPHDAYYDKQIDFMNEKGYIGSILVNVIPRDEGDEDEEEDDDEEEEEEEEEDTSKYTEAQMNGLRFVLMTQKRNDAMDKMHALILRDQANSRLKMFNTSYSNWVRYSIYAIKALLNGETPADKFDLLFGYTYVLKYYDYWMQDNEGDMDEFTNELASIWKRLLKKSNADLGIDAEYTRPAIEEFLQLFKNEIENENENEMKFNYETEKTVSPHDAYFDKLIAFNKKGGYIGKMQINEMPWDEEDEEEDDDDDDEEEDTSKYTEAQMNGLRFVLMTQKRNDKMEEMHALILGDQANSSLKMFNTSFSYTVRDSIYTIKSLLNEAKTPADKFDLLFGYTYILKHFDVWMHDNEGDMDEFTNELASIWKRLLKKSNADLGIDAEYTRPAIEEFLHLFKNEIENENDNEMEFNYK
jgi:hypothetical protein